jgi:NAD(P)-dependent dehydrogenase (short-subunit alcohol dehydrogenase family)
MTTFNLTKIASQKGKTAIVTGANTGIGFETALALAEKNAHVIMACRNLQKAQVAKANILTKFPKASIEMIQLDLNSLQSVRDFVVEFSKNHQKLDLLINNAGLMIPPLMRTKDGFESQLGVNYLGHFLLTGLLLPVLEKTTGSRVISLSSIAHRNAQINFKDLNSEKSYSRFKAYGQSKLACLMFAYELDRRLKKKGSTVKSIAAHPGVSNTELARYVPKVFYFLLYPLFMMMTQSPENAALPSLYGALVEDLKGGEYIGPTSRNEMKGNPGIVGSEPQSHDEEAAKKLWEVSEELTNIHYLS